MSRSAFTLFAVSLLMLGAFADARDTPEEVALAHIALAISAHSRAYGRPPRDWNEVNNIVALEVENKRLRRLFGYGIEERYQLIHLPMSLPDDDDLQYKGTQVLLIRTIPLSIKPDNGGKAALQRYIIYQDINGHINNATVPEEKVQRMLAQSGTHLTPHTGSPAADNQDSMLDIKQQLQDGAVLGLTALLAILPLALKRRTSALRLKTLRN